MFVPFRYGYIPLMVKSCEQSNQTFHYLGCSMDFHGEDLKKNINTYIGIFNDLTLEFHYRVKSVKIPQDGAPKIAQLPYEWLNSMAFGRYHELVNGCFHGVYKPTYNWGAPSCSPYQPLIAIISSHHCPLVVTNSSRRRTWP